MAAPPSHRSRLLSPPPAAAGGAGTPTVWSHVETTQLIDAYQQKWHALERGQFRAHQWEEVAQAVAARCGFDPPSKTALQCRHKIEKLRKRYRAELLAGPASAGAWPFFPLMDLLERGPMMPHSDHSSQSASSSSAGAESSSEEAEKNNIRSINRILQRPGPTRPLPEQQVPRLPRSPIFKTRNLLEGGDEDRDQGEGKGLGELASAIRAFGEGFVKMETMKMEMARETERSWLEMEKRRTEMIISSQQKIADAIKAAMDGKSNHVKEET